MSESAKENASAKKARGGMGWFGAVVLLVVLCVGGGVGYHYYEKFRHFEHTDDAFLAATVTAVAPQVAGRVIKVYVMDDQPVHKGDLLMELDRRPLEAELAKARASAALAEARMETSKLNVSLTEDTTGADVDNFEAEAKAAEAAVLEAEAGVRAAQSDATRAKDDAKRFESLLTDSAVSQQQRDAVASADTIAEAKVAEARKRLAAAQSQVQAAQARLVRAKTGPLQVAITESEVRAHEAEIAQAKADAARIELDLTYTKLYAPEDGVITGKSIEDGEYVVAGQRVMNVVQRNLYVEANFKETQLTDMRPGQAAELELDILRGRVFKGHVHSIQSGTGAVFSLLPPQNATGNYVKVVQRVPVKIVFDEELPSDVPLAVGMSVVPTVRVR